VLPVEGRICSTSRSSEGRIRALTLASGPDAGIPREEVERRLEELRALYRFGRALLEARFVDEPSRVAEVPPPFGEQPPGTPTDRDESPKK